MEADSIEPILGDDFQETKIAEMSERAHKLFPQVGVHLFKGMFRVSIRSALAHEESASWEEVHRRAPPERKTFFERVLEGTRDMIEEEGLLADEIGMLFGELRDLNDKYWSAE